MEELIRLFKGAWPRSGLLLIPPALLLLVIMSGIILFVSRPSADPAPSPTPTPSAEPASQPSPEPSEKPLLITAEQIAQLRYTDSTLGELSWTLSEQSLQELNETLVNYNIVTPEEICHFLAQATVETGGGLQLTELGTEEYFRAHGINAGTRGAGYFHLTHDYGQMAFATWMMKRYIPALSQIEFVNPACNSGEDVADAYYAALQTAANLGLNVSRFSRIVYDPNSGLTTGADYIARNFAWESAGYYWMITGMGEVLDGPNAPESAEQRVNAVSALMGGVNRSSRWEAFQAFAPILIGEEW